MRLSNRLKTIASFLPKGAYFADIGSDHALLPSYVCLHDINARAIAGEVAEGPYQAAKNTIEKYGLTRRVDVRLGSGLEVVKGDSIKQIVVAGMGGGLITSILESGKAALKSVDRIIVQPNVGEKRVRKWFSENRYKITAEKIVSEKDHLYEIIVADKVAEANQIEMDARDLWFGPYLLKNKNDLFYKKWKSKQEKIENILKNYQQATFKNEGKVLELTEEINLIKEVLSDV